MDLEKEIFDEAEDDVPAEFAVIYVPQELFDDPVKLGLSLSCFEYPQPLSFPALLACMQHDLHRLERDCSRCLLRPQRTNLRQRS